MNNSERCLVEQALRDVRAVVRRLEGMLNARNAREADACVPMRGRTYTRERDLYPNSNLTIKQIDITEGAQGPSSKASINQFLNLDFVLGVAKKYMNEIPDWYVKWWHATQTANGWTTNQGKSITDKSWRPLLMTWWRNADEKERSRIENEAKAEKSAAEAKKVYSAADWAACGQAGCLYYNDEKCICSLLVSVPPKVPRKCTKFAKVRD